MNASNVWVKICGLTTEADVHAAVEAGADAVGFVLAPSPRRIDPDTARRIGVAAAGRALRVAVTVDLDPDALVRVAEAAGVDAVQPHGRHQTAAVVAAEAAGFTVIRPLALDPDDLAGSLSAVDAVPEDRIVLVDRAVAGRHGGTGIAHADATLDALATVRRPFVLAGGLTPDTVADAVRRSGAWGVDVASGVESSPGRKSPERIRAFVAAARTAVTDPPTPRP